MSARKKPLYHSGGKGEDKISFAGYSGGKAVCRPTANNLRASTTYRDVEPNISVREDYGFKDYERFRPSNTVPRDQQEIMKLANQAYYRVGIVRNVLDMMSDFATKGCRPIHKSPRINKLYQQWWKTIDGKTVSERYINTLYRLGNVVIVRDSAKINDKKLAEWKKYRSAAKYLTKSATYEIPYTYTFLNPTCLEILEETEIAIYKKNVTLGIRVDLNTLDSLVKAGIVSKANVTQKNASSEYIIPLDMSKTVLGYYKKDDWQPWAYPFTYAIMDNLLMVEKLRLADFAALDGAISHVRLWKLGDLEHKIIPKDAAIDKLSDILINSTGGGPIDIIWGPDINLTETSTEVHKFLGIEKYIPHMNAIYEGLGVPPTLTGSQLGSGASNNFVSLKTIIERLCYARAMLSAMWENEFAIFAGAVGLAEPATLIYDRMNLKDDAAEQAIALQMYDRNLLSDEAMQLLVGENPEIERARIRRDEKMRKDERIPRKAGPWNNPEHKEALEKVALQRGIILPKDVGLETSVPDNVMIDMIKPKPAAAPGGKGIPQQGRPKTSKDKTKRKKKPLNPVRAEVEQWAKGALIIIDKQLEPLNSKLEGSSRDLTKLKFHILNQFELYQKVTKASIINALNLPVLTDSPEIVFLNAMLDSSDANPNEIIIQVYSTYKGVPNAEV